MLVSTKEKKFVGNFGHLKAKNANNNLEGLMNFTNELLETMTIYKLRDFAREMGVKAPTTKRRSQIIEELKIHSE